MRTADRFPGIGIQAERLTQTGRRGARYLDDVSLAVEPGELVAVIGASGAGKTMLLEALAGVRRPSAGAVRFLPPVEPSARSAGVVGFVPQDDIIHRDLPLASTLRYAARLRLPGAPARAMIDARVARVLADLGLSDRADARVGSLSGGERKRASVAVELLTRPRVFLLDEPTSGLDPTSAADLVDLLRALAESGVTTVFSTHNPTDAESADRVVVLARGGRLAFDGPVPEAPSRFGVATVAQIYGALARGTGPAEQPAPTPTREPPPPGSKAAGRPGGRLAGSPARRGTTGGVRQCLILATRAADIMRHNRLTLAILVGSPLVVLAMFVTLFRPGAFSPAHPSPSTTVMILFWIAFGGFFFGLTYGLLQICAESTILRREMVAGVRVGPYVLSKVAVLLPPLAVVDLLLLGVLRGLDRLPALGASALAGLYVTLLLASACALALGLLCSALVSDATQATLALPMLCFPQVLFVGAILPVPLMAPVGRWISVAMSNRWSFEALGHGAGVERLWRGGASPLGPPLLATYGHSFGRPVWQDWLILAGFTVAFLVATAAVLARRRAATR